MNKKLSPRSPRVPAAGPAVLAGLGLSPALLLAWGRTALAAAGGPDPARLERIYRRPEFIWAHWQESAIAWLNAFLGRLLAGLAAATGGNYKLLGWIGASVIGVLAVLGIVWLRRHLHGSAALSIAMAQRGFADPIELEAEAQRLAAAGNWSEAIRRLLRAFLLHLDRRGLLPFDPARTNREVLRFLLPRYRGAGGEFRRLLLAADEVTYAGRRASQPVWQEAEAGYRQALAALAAADGGPLTAGDGGVQP